MQRLQLHKVLLALPLQWSMKLGRLQMWLLHVYSLLFLWLLSTPAREIGCSRLQLNRAWVVEGAVTVLLAVAIAGASARVGVNCTCSAVGKRCLELNKTVTFGDGGDPLP